MRYSRLTSNVVIVSGEQWRDSAIQIDISLLIQTALPSRLSHGTEQSSMCSTVGPCWLTILNIAVFWVAAAKQQLSCLVIAWKSVPLSCWPEAAISHFFNSWTSVVQRAKVPQNCLLQTSDVKSNLHGASSGPSTKRFGKSLQEPNQFKSRRASVHWMPVS